MNRHILGGCMLLAASLAMPGHASAENPEELALLRLLEESLDMKDFHDAQGFENVLKLLNEKFEAKGKELKFLVHAAEFKEGSKARQIIDGQLPIRFPASPRRLPTARV